MILEILPKKVLSPSERTTNSTDFSQIKIKNRFIYNYQVKNFLKDKNNLINPYISFKMVLFIVLLDIKGKIGFLHANSEGICDYLDENNIPYFVEKKGSYYYLSLIQNLA